MVLQAKRLSINVQYYFGRAQSRKNNNQREVVHKRRKEARESTINSINSTQFVGIADFPRYFHMG